MNIRLVSDFLLDLRDRPADEILSELEDYRASSATRAAFLTARNMREVGGWTEMGEFLTQSAKNPLVDLAFDRGEVYAPTKYDWSIMGVHCNET